MGMSASQMRYVLLTGKKSDVEYQGQQINQQRTTLATETSTMNAQLLNLSVPTPPSSDQFTKTTYILNANGQQYSVTGVQYQTATADYTVFLSNEQTTSRGRSSGSSLFSSPSAGVYLTSQGSQLTRVVTNPADPEYSATDISNTALITQDANLPANSVFYKYVSNGITKYVTQANLQTSAGSTNNIPTYYVDDNAKETVNSRLNGAQVTWNDTGRMTAITDATGNTFSLNVTTTNDSDAYNDAYNEYEYKKADYDKQLDNINAKICIIESQDKKLELKLKDLDTQQEAIQTEMESVKKVVDKNIESSFKAFA